MPPRVSVVSLILPILGYPSDVGLGLVGRAVVSPVAEVAVVGVGYVRNWSKFGPDSASNVRIRQILFATSPTCAIRFLLVRPFSGVAPTYEARQPAGSVVQAARKDETKRTKPYHAKG